MRSAARYRRNCLSMVGRSIVVREISIGTPGMPTRNFGNPINPGGKPRYRRVAVYCIVWPRRDPLGTIYRRLMKCLVLWLRAVGEKRIYRHHPTYQLVASADTIRTYQESHVCIYALVMRPAEISSDRSRLFCTEYLIPVWFRFVEISFNIERRDQRDQVNVTIVQWHDASIKRIKIRGFVIICVSTLFRVWVFIFTWFKCMSNMFSRQEIDTRI